MDTFGDELGVKFKHQLEGGHVINPKQIKVLTLAVGINGTNLNFSFYCRERFDYKVKEELGETFCDLAERAPGGVLLFFSSKD